jgi:hypothetical protein
VVTASGGTATGTVKASINNSLFMAGSQGHPLSIFVLIILNLRGAIETGKISY